MFSPAHDLVCRKRRILLTLGRTYHQAPSLHGIPCHPFFPRSFHSPVPSNLRGSHESIVNSGFGEITIYQNNVWRTKLLALLEEDNAVFRLTKTPKLRIPSQHPKRTLPGSNTCCPPRNWQPSRLPENPPGSNTRVCLDFVYMTFLCHKMLYLANVRIAVVVLKFLSSIVLQKLQGKGGGRKMVLSVVKAVPASSEPTAADDSMRTSTDDFSALAPSLTRASPMPFLGTRSLTILPELVKLVGSSSTRGDNVQYIRTSLHLRRHPPYSRESSYPVSRQPRQDVAAEPDAAVLLDAVYSCYIVLHVFEPLVEVVAFYRNICQVLEILDKFSQSS